MERVVENLVTYRSVDGRIFGSGEDCLRHEAAMPRREFYRLAYPNRVLASHTGAFQYGYTTTTTRTETESPGFLRAGGDYTVEDHHDTILGVALGTYDAVVALAVENEEFWRNRRGAFIRETAFADLRSAR